MVMDVADWDQRVSDSGESLVHRLRRWAGEAHWQLLSFHKGRIVKRMNNGLMMEFADARSCLQAAFALGQLADSRADASKRLRLRAGAHLANYSQRQDELVGPDVRLTSGLTALAKPGEVLVTAELRNRLADGLDADFEDLGYRRVESSNRPVRLFRASSGQRDVSDWKMIAHHDLRPGLAVIPFQGGIPEAKRWMIGELIAEGVIARLSHSIGFRVISRQSTSALRDRGGLGEIERHLGATFVLSGSYSIRGKKLIVCAELAEARSHTLLWSGQLEHAVDDLLQEDSELLYELACTVAQTLGKAQVRKPLAQPLPRLDSNVLLLTGISMTHSHSAKTFERGREALTELTVRHPGLALPRAWLGMWYALNVVKGSSDEVAATPDERASRPCVHCRPNPTTPWPWLSRATSSASCLAILAGAQRSGCSHRGQPERTHGLAVQEFLFRHVGLHLGIGDRGVYGTLPLAGRSLGAIFSTCSRATPCVQTIVTSRRSPTPTSP